MDSPSWTRTSAKLSTPPICVDGQLPIIRRVGRQSQTPADILIGMYTRPAMREKRCPLCGKRTARRDCPAKATKICSVCCGTKREVEIDCPPDCVHLARGRAWESGRTQGPPARGGAFSEQFLNRHGATIGALVQAIVEERARTPSLLDADVMAALEALRATLRTLDSGLYYDTRPEGSFAASALYARLKDLLDTWTGTQSHPSAAPGVGQRVEERAGQSVLKVSEASAVLGFLELTGQARGSDRPRSRRFLDWLGTVVPGQDEPPRLIVP
jgi:hypothetical protein